MAFNFGAKTTASTGLFGFGTTTTTASTGFGGFGKTTSTPFSFGAATTTTASVFSLGAKPAAGVSAFSFGANPAPTASAFSFGSKPAGFGCFGAPTSASTGFGATTGLFSGTATQAQALQQQQAIPENPLAALQSAISMPTLFGDERDAVIAKLNQVQALWGHGKAFYSTTAQPITFTPENPFCRFKTIGYSCLPSAKDSDGFVSLDLTHKEDYVKQNQSQFVDSIHKVLGGNQMYSVCVDGVRSLPGDKSEVIIYVVERQPNGASRRILATELYAVLSQDNIKKQLTQLGVENMVAKTALNESQLKQFLDNAPLGVDGIIWKQAKKDNPDPKRLIPVPMMGFNELRTRIQHQQYQNTQHQNRLDILQEELSKLQAAQSSTMAKLAQYKRKHLEFTHRTLEVMIRQENTRKVGYSIEPEEEQLRIELEALQAELNAPMQFKGRLNELMAQTRLQSQLSSSQRTEYAFNEQTKQEIKRHLDEQQNGLLSLIGIMREDFEDLKIMENGVLDSVYIHRR